ncbi:hypothetical protein K3495_g5166 [Podosphaera aphanis]|nr:hypothetical protein K3495_g5166 [Podosphaera aphanis]
MVNLNDCLEKDTTEKGVSSLLSHQTVTNETVPNNGERDTEFGRSPTLVASTEDIALKALHIDDTPSLDPWTFRMFFLGILLSAFGSVLATIFLFKPQPVSVSIIFLTVISYAAGNAMEVLLPSNGFIGKWLNPHSFNSKEHIAILIMAHSASGAAYATEVLAAQKLYYGIVPNTIVAILLLLSSQLLGYGFAGILRNKLVYPTKMVWPQILPLSSLIETLHRDKSEMRKKFSFFWIIFVIIAAWELFPQYIMPALTGISFFCLANKKSLVFTNIFGGSNGNEGLGVLGLSFDWQYISTASLFLPLITLANGFIGYILCIALFCGLYYGNFWDALKFPFLAQQLFSQNSTSTSFQLYNQSKILDSNRELNTTALEIYGTPYFAATHASYLLTTNLGVGATLLHIFLWNRGDLEGFFGGLQISSLKKFRLSSLFRRQDSVNRRSLSATELAKLDPHYRQMLVYDEVPAAWYISILIISICLAMFCIYNLKSTLPWWGLLVSCFLSSLTTLFMGIMAGQLGFYVPITSVIQLVGGYLHPGKPVANMYFVLFGANSQTQALNLIGSLKFGQYGKLSPKCTFTVQIIGTVLGAILNYVVMSSVTTNQRETLLSIQGTNIWSGQVIQSFNSNAIAFGGLSKYVFGIGRTYESVIIALPLGLLIPLPFYLLHRWFPSLGLNNIITPIICWCLGFLSVGINSSMTMFYLIGFLVQFYVRRRHLSWFLKYNYLLAAAISGGTELLVFITTFAVQGASGKEVVFPPYWGNNYQQGYFDYCAENPALKH